MKTYYAYEILDRQYGAEIGVDTDAHKIWERLQNDIAVAGSSGGIEAMRVGMVLADTPEEAIARVRNDDWATVSEAYAAEPAEPLPDEGKTA